MLNWHPLVNTLVAVVLFAGIPVMLYLSWYFDFTAEGLKPVFASDQQEDELAKFGLVHWIFLIAITLCSGYIGYQVYYDIKSELDKQAEPEDASFSANSIAVIPFKDNSPSQDQDYLAQGIAEEISNLLGRFKEFKVASTSSTSRLADQQLTPVEIAKLVNVQTVITGSVRKNGNQLKVFAELLNAEDGRVLWSDNFSRNFEDIFFIESEIARSIVNLIQDSYVTSDQMANQARTQSTEAYVVYLKGREQYSKQTTESMKQARALFEQAIGLDPEYAQAYISLADTLLLLSKGDTRFGVLDPDIAVNLATEKINNALLRSDTNAEAFAILGKTFELTGNQQDALDAYEKATELNPSLAKAYMWKHLLLKNMARYAESFEAIEKAIELDPVSLATMSNYALALEYIGEVEEAKKQYSLIKEYFPEFSYTDD